MKLYKCKKIKPQKIVENITFSLETGTYFQCEIPKHTRNKQRMAQTHNGNDEANKNTLLMFQKNTWNRRNSSTTFVIWLCRVQWNLIWLRNTCDLTVKQFTVMLNEYFRVLYSLFNLLILVFCMLISLICAMKKFIEDQWIGYFGIKSATNGINEMSIIWMCPMTLLPQQEYI